MKAIFLKKDYLFLYALLMLVYITGLFIPVMENDSAQHATMAMRMYLENDFLNIYKGTNDYLDKPHLHFWLAAISFKVFGISHWAYRIPSLLFTVLAAYSCFKLAKEFYGNYAGHIAALIFLSTQAIILANHDVRTDAILTGATIFSIWQLTLYINNNTLKNSLLGAFGLGLAFSTKGHLGIFISGICILTHIIYTKKWNIIWNWKTGLGIVVFIITILPVLYAYYVQFDLHPEKIIHGKTNNSGVRFILWDHSFERLNAKHETQSPDYFFFFHTLLWACIPWALLVYIALFYKLKHFWNTKFKHQKNNEIVTSVGFLIIMLIISFSKFKLPHYLNGLLPLSAILITGFILCLKNNNKAKIISVLLYIQQFTSVILLIAILIIMLWMFPIQSPIYITLYIVMFIGFCWLLFQKMTALKRLLYTSIITIVFVNFCLNTQLYPKLLNYQSGSKMVSLITNKNINFNTIYRLSGRNSWSLDFYTNRITPVVKANKVNSNLKNGDWLFFYSEDLKKIQQQHINWTTEYVTDYYPVSEIRPKFINPKTRNSVLQKAYLVKLKID